MVFRWRLKQRCTALPQTDSKDVFGEGRGGVDVIQELVDKVNAQVRPAAAQALRGQASKVPVCMHVAGVHSTSGKPGECSAFRVQGKSWEQVYDEIATHEMEILNALVDGSALEEHMETFYLETLKACVMATVSKTDPSS